MMQFSSADFVSWQVLRGATSQSGNNTVIKLGANDMLTLVNVSAAGPASGEF